MLFAKHHLAIERESQSPRLRGPFRAPPPVSGTESVPRGQGEEIADKGPRELAPGADLHVERVRCLDHVAWTV